MMEVTHAVIKLNPPFITNAQNNRTQSDMKSRPSISQVHGSIHQSTTTGQVQQLFH